MAQLDEYQIGDPFITVAAASKFIAAHAPPGTDRAKAYNSNYSKIDYARANGYLPKSRGMDSHKFFTWAAAQDCWQYLKSIKGLSFSTNVTVTGLQATAEVGDGASAVPLPDDPLELREFALSLTQRKEQADRQSAKDLEELNRYREAAKSRSAVCAENGRTGGVRKKSR